MVVWISLLCAAEHTAHHGTPVEAMAHAVVQLVCLTLGAMEVGQAESGIRTSGVRPIRILAAVVAALYLSAVTYFSVRG